MPTEKRSGDVERTKMVLVKKGVGRLSASHMYPFYWHFKAWLWSKLGTSLWWLPLSLKLQDNIF